MGITTKIKSLHLLAVVFMLMSTTNLLAQLTGIKTIPGNYATISAAVTALNTQGVGTGGVTFNVASGHTESITAPILITATGTIANPIVIQKSGTGANPVITRTNAGTTNGTTLGANLDAIVIIQGSDFLTINGINLTASVAASTTTGIEYGYYLRKASGTNGCKNITITNCTITMNKGTSGVVTGIMSSNNDALSTTSSATGITVTSIGGRNENLTFSNNTIRNVHHGIYVRGFVHSSPWDFYDHNITITGNTFNNLGGGSTSTSYGLYMIYYHDVVASNNVYNNIASGGVAGTGFRYGLMFSSSSDHGNLTVTNNTVTLTTTSGSKYAMYSSGSSPTGTLNISSNTFSFPTNTQTGSTYGIYRFGTAATATMSNNTINSFTASSGIFYGIYNTGNGTTSNNTIAGYTMGGTSTQYPMYISNANMTAFGNTVSNVTYTGTGTFYGFRIGSGNTTSSFYNNSISNITTGGTTYCIYAASPTGMDAYNNSVSNITATGNTSNLSGFYLTAGSGINFNRNKIANLTGTKAGSSVYGISIVSGSSTITNNVIGDLKTPIASSTSSDRIRGISITATATNTSHVVDYNTIYLNASSTGASFSTAGIFQNSNATATSANLTLRNNVVINLSTPNGTGVSSVLRRSAATQLNNFNAASDNNMMFAGTPSTSRVIYMEGTAIQQTLANYQTLAAPRDAYAMTGETFNYATAGSFFTSLTPTSADFLKPVAGITTQVEGGAIQIAGITNDYANVTRAGNAGYTGTGAAPDRGAFEFNGVTTAPQITLTASNPSVAVSCTPSTHAFTFNIASTGSAVTSAVLSYAFNGAAQPNITLTNTSGTTWEGTIPVATPVTATVTWSVIATNAAGSTLFNGPTYADAPLLGIIANATSDPSTICFGDTSSISVALANSNPPVNYTTPGVGSPLFDEDFGGITITQGTTTILSNTTPINSLVGTIGTATGTEGSYSNFTAFGPYTMNAGQTYDFSISSLTTGVGYNNSMAIFIDYNRNGSFADAGEMVYTPTATAAGAYTVTGSFSIPATALNGQTRMRVVCLETLITSSASISSWGEFEDYMLNIVSTNFGGGAVPAITAVAWSAGTTAVGTNNPQTVTPTASSTYTALVSAAGCQVTSTPTTVAVLTLPAAPIVTNSTHCGFQIPTASVASVVNGGGNNTFNWYTDALATAVALDSIGTTYDLIVSSTSTFYVNENGINGCLSPLVPVVVTVTAPPAINIATSVTPTLCLGSDITLTATAAATPAYSFSWNTASYAGSGMSAAQPGAGLTTTPTTAGTYVYTVTGTNANCSNQVSQTVVINPNPEITLAEAAPAPICSGSTLNLVAESIPSLPGSVTAGTGLTGNGTTSWPSPYGNWYWGAKQQFLFTAAELTALNLLPGTISSVAFDVTAQSNAAGFTNYTVSMANTSVTALTTTFETGLTQVYFNAYLQPSGLGYANNTLVFQTPFVWDGTSNVVIEICFNNTNYTNNALARYTNAFAGASHYRYADANGVCAYTNGGFLSANRTNMKFEGTVGTNVTSTYNWLWAALNATTATTTTVLNNTTTAPTTQAGYLVTATNPLTGCFSTATTNSIVVNPLPVVSAGVDQLICSNNPTEATTLTGSSSFGTGVTYAWSGPVSGVLDATAFQIGATGTFVVTGTDVNGCVDTDDVLITYSTIPVANAGVDQAICLNQTATFNAAGLAPYTWTMTNYANSGLAAPFTGNALVVTPTAPGTYTYQVNVQNTVGCTNTDQAVLTVYALPVVNAGVDQTVCNASPATLSGSGAITYAWVTTHPSLNVSNATPFFPSQTASYTVTGTDINGCQNQDVAVVNVIPQPLVNAGLDQTICAGTPVILNATTTLASPTAVVSPFTWTGGYANNSQFVPTTSQTLTVSVVGANGCTNQDQMSITVLALPTVSAGVDQTICAGTGATLNATGAATYVWNNNVTQGVPFFPTASQIYTVTGVGANGCTNVDQVQVNVATGPSVTVSAAQTVCANDAATFSAVPQNSLGGFWTTSGNGTISPSISSAAITYLPAANDPVVVTLTYVATNACGSTSSATNVNVLPIPTVNAGPDQTICDGSSVVLNATGNATVTWLTPNVSNGLAFIPVTTTTYTAMATGLNNCANQDEVTVTVVALPDVNAGDDVTICSGEQVTLAATGATAYQWTGGIANGTAFAPGTSATYTVTGTTANGCAGTDQVTVYVNATPEAIASIVDDVTLTATPGVYNYQWINCATGTAVPNASFATFNALANGTYAVIVSTPQGCSDQSDCITIDAVSIDQIAEIAMSVQPNPTSGELSISMPTDLTAQAQVFDAQGKLVIDLTNVTNGSTLNLSNMTTGVYMIRITAADSVQTFRVVKQ